MGNQSCLVVLIPSYFPLVIVLAGLVNDLAALVI